jgi:superfamily I DNA/RNA helicase
LTESLFVQELGILDVPVESSTRSEFLSSETGRFVLAVLRLVCDRNDYIAYRTLLGLFNGVGVSTCNSIAGKVTSNNLNYRAVYVQDLPPGIFSTREVHAIENVCRILVRILNWNADDELAANQDSLDEALTELGGQQATQLWHAITEGLPPAVTMQELRDYIWTNNDEQQANVLESAYERLGLPVPEQGLLPARVRIMTMHSAKGLSAKVVFIPCLEEEILPGEWRRPYAGLVLEAARILYVSVTRARLACFLSYSTRRTIYGKSTATHASRFCNDLGGTFVFSREAINEQEAGRLAEGCSDLD